MSRVIPQFGSDAWFLDPSPWYNYMRRSSPVFTDSDSGTCHVFSYADVERVLTQFRTFSSQFGGYEDRGGADKVEQARGRDVNDGSEEEGGATIMLSMLGTDPPIHTKLRNIVSVSFTPSAISAMEPRIREIATELLEKAKPGETIDIVSEFAEPLPVTVIAEMLGISTQDRKQFKLWSDNEIGSSEHDYITRRNLHLELVEYFGKIIEERRKRPGKDLISSIVTSEINGERLSRQEAISFCILLLIAGNETTTNLIGNAVRLFAKHKSFGKLRDTPSLMPSAIEEVLRFSSPVRGMFRVAVEDATISARKIRAGQSLMAWIGSANRDEAIFPRADEFDIERKPNPHIAFGHGIHMCLGAPLARLEARVGLGLLIEKFGGLNLIVQDENLEPVRNVAIGGVKHLPVLTDA